MKNLLKNKQGAFSDLFLFLIFSFVIVLICVIWIYLGGVVENQLHLTMDDMEFSNPDTNATQIINDTIGKTNISFQALRWVSVFLMFGMILSIFIGSYLVTTKPIFFVPYIFIVIIAIIVSVPMANAYEILMADATLSGTFNEFTGANWVMLNLPIFISIIGFTGGIIMFSRMGKKEENMYGY
jgi:hypothetical protein